ncbi:MAG: hypothetical protein F4X44_10325 [Gammaproteobacteria bacterium]|nr:hypothetical protein [Gammaproteobacteria bacterium]MYD80993.1 hypothetical protein [Gammaproteobacteria bacterium]
MAKYLSLLLKLSTILVFSTLLLSCSSAPSVSCSGDDTTALVKQIAHEQLEKSMAAIVEWTNVTEEMANQVLLGAQWKLDLARPTAYDENTCAATLTAQITSLDGQDDGKPETQDVTYTVQQVEDQIIVVLYGMDQFGFVKYASSLDPANYRNW